MLPPVSKPARAGAVGLTAVLASARPHEINEDGSDVRRYNVRCFASPERPRTYAAPFVMAETTTQAVRVYLEPR